MTTNLAQVAGHVPGPLCGTGTWPKLRATRYPFFSFSTMFLREIIKLLRFKPDG
jgi:hypothetical protein